MKNKKAATMIIEELLTMVILVAVLAILLLFVWRNASGNAYKEQVIAKETCMITTLMPQGSVIEVLHDEGFGTEQKENGFLVKAGSDTGYFYPCYNKDVSVKSKQSQEKGKSITVIEK